MNENWDEIADDESEWGEPVVVDAVGKRAEAVLSVRLPMELAEEVRLRAGVAGVKVGTFLRQIVERQVWGTPGEVIYLRYQLDASKRQTTTGDLEWVVDESAQATG